MRKARVDYKFGGFGGLFVAEALNYATQNLFKAFVHFNQDHDFVSTVHKLLSCFVGRPSPLYKPERLNTIIGGAQLLFKREDLNATGSHKITNVVGQAALARLMHKQRLIAETGAGQHGLAVATLAAKFGFRCTIYMGHHDAIKQHTNVKRMKMMGADVKLVKSNTSDLRAALSEAIRDWITNASTAFYVLGTAAGPHPYPRIVQSFQRIIGDECWLQNFAYNKQQPVMIVACIGGGSNAVGLFSAAVKHMVCMIGVEALGCGAPHVGSSSLCYGVPGVLHGFMSYVIQTLTGFVVRTNSLSAGLDYPGVGPAHAFWKTTKRTNYTTACDSAMLRAFVCCSRLEGVTPAFESCHAVFYAMVLAGQLSCKHTILVNLSGTGSKDVSRIIQLASIQ